MSLAGIFDSLCKLNPFGALRFAALGERHGRRASQSVEIRALGTFQVSVGGVPQHQLGGRHAGARQAQAILAMLFDRGPRGIAKDEVIDIVWPESNLAVADLSFHRTLGGLRRALSPAAPREAVEYFGGRYRLGTRLAIGSDVEAFEDLLERAGRTTGDERARLLESAQDLYGGDYLDDCAYYGDSAAVEQRRAAFRELYLQVGRELSALYRSRGMSTLALLRAAEGRRRLANDGGWDGDAFAGTSAAAVSIE